MELAEIFPLHCALGGGVKSGSSGIVVQSVAAVEELLPACSMPQFLRVQARDAMSILKCLEGSAGQRRTGC